MRKAKFPQFGLTNHLQTIYQQHKHKFNEYSYLNLQLLIKQGVIHSDACMITNHHLNITMCELAKPIIAVHSSIPEQLEKIEKLAATQTGVTLEVNRLEWKRLSFILNYTNAVVDRLNGCYVVKHLATQMDTVILDAINNGETVDELFEMLEDALVN